MQVHILTVVLILIINSFFLLLLIAAAMLDLEQALKLSNSGGRTGCRALCQRGILRLKAEDIEGARADFEKAAKLGSQFARSQVCYYMRQLLCMQIIDYK